MATCTLTSLKCSTAYRRGCRCDECQAYKRSRKESPEINARRSREWRKNNPEASRKRSKDYYDNHKELLFERSIKKLYNLSMDSYNEMMASCGGNCMICGNPPSGMSNSRGRLHIDHDHVTGKVRGLLCGACNIGLGHFNHDRIRLMDAQIYLEESIDIAE